MEKKRILIVDDEVDFLSVLDKYLTDKGYEVTTCATGQEGINKAKEQVYDFIIVDIRMPGINGIETIKNMVKIKHNKTRFLIITGYALTKDVTLTLKQNRLIRGYLIKPFDLEELKNKIEQIFGRGKPR